MAPRISAPDIGRAEYRWSYLYHLSAVSTLDWMSITQATGQSLSGRSLLPGKMQWLSSNQNGDLWCRVLVVTD